MTQTIVALDVETTGLDADRDAIIEIGALKLRGSRVEAEWTSLINPRRHVPEFITSLTGIDDAMLRQAPAFRDVVPELSAFIGDAAILGHNIRFDLSFLRKGIPLASNGIIDTYELAAVLLPSASRYNLGALGKELGVLFPATHRALDDARVTHAVYLRLRERAGELPAPVVREIVHLGEQLEWGGGAFFKEILEGEKTRSSPRRKTEVPAAMAGGLTLPALETPDSPLPLDPDETAAILQHGGAFARYFDSFEHRPEQVEMLRAVTQALSRGQHLMVEAGTGVGKSFAYLIPAALFAVRNNTRVLISTNTINLQDQLIRKDIPDLASALGLDLRAAVLKGRANYLCPRRLESARRFAPRNDVELRVLAKVLVWQLTDSGGDRSTLNLNGNAERDVWLRLSAEDDGCTTETCLKRTGGACPFHRARMAAQAAHLLVVNHALLLSDVAAEGKVLPEYAYLIVDEGHHLESATTSALSFRATQSDLDRMLKEIGGTASGILSRIPGAAKQGLSPGALGQIQSHLTRATDLGFRFDQLGREFFARLTDFVGNLREGDPVSQYAWQARIVPATRALEAWEAVEMAWASAAATLRLFLSTIAELQQVATSSDSGQSDDLEDVIGDLSTAARRLAEVEQQLSSMITRPAAEQIYWIEVRAGGNGVSLNAAPLRVGPLIERFLWHEKSAMIVTSATLTTHGEFQYLRNTLGADEADELQLGSPFDYESSTLLFVANDIPEPNAPEYQQVLHRALIATARAAGGRTLALFTSYSALKRASQAISAPLARDDILVFEQGEGASPNALLESFRAADRAILLGTRSFWEGVDVPGEALSVLVIPKLPFDVPTDPLVAARAETYEDPFGEYYIPEAILRFRQGFGRLIRAASDRGIVAILDRRILSKQYGRLFLDSVPRCTMRQGPIANLAIETTKWLRR
jgi:ATP-dependent DNA helicase DinG